MITIEQFEIRLLIALLLGAAIGLERQWRHKMAGVKTNALVSLGSALFILLSDKITGDNSSAARIAAQIVTGIGFLGAGAIMKEGFSVSGLNTAATIWCSGAVGCLAGLGFWYEASIGTFFIIVSHLILRPVENKIEKRIGNNHENSRFRLTIKCEVNIKDDVRNAIYNATDTFNNMKIDTYHIEYITEKNIVIEVLFKIIDKAEEDMLLINNNLSKIKAIQTIKWETLS
jgi:putative Mg2+ transporter-C (MgtC) family protein